MSEATKEGKNEGRKETMEEVFAALSAEFIPKVKRRLGADLKVSYCNLRSGENYSAAGNKPGWAASMIKVPVMVAALREIDQGNLSLEEELEIDHTFTLDPSTEISSRPQGYTADVFELLNYMILASCNESTNMLGNRVGIPRINGIMRELGCPNTRMSHLLHYGAELVDPGIDGTFSNTTTAGEMTTLMALIYTDKAASPEACRQMKAILENLPEREYAYKSVNTCISSFLPAGTVVGAKCGLLEEDIMETACINREYVVTVMINKIPKKFLGIGNVLIGVISQKIFEAQYQE